MKNLKLTFGIGLMAICLAFLSSCKKDNDRNESMTGTSSEENQESLNAIEADFLEVISFVNIEHATIDDEPSLINNGVSCMVDQPDISDENANSNSSLASKRPCIVCNCSGVFAEMRLSDAQKQRLRRSWMAYNDCVKSARERLANLHQSILEEYKMEYHKIQRMYRAGKITKAEYERMIHRLRMSYNEKMESLKERKLLCAAIARCHRQYLNHVNSILTPMQWRKFVECKKRCILQAKQKRNDRD